ncbi:Aprataxin and PNK-like factor [Merluccius polli]|uniref:Aprataxin and PNK-like factor n=1 Tax=Merluccius polli TaxID=89951 RepID=A0AA47MYT8_MERPO|nr:Aprataxin and PNK-like factor [Merluccius polli]
MSPSDVTVCRNSQALEEVEDSPTESNDMPPHVIGQQQTPPSTTPTPCPPLANHRTPPSPAHSPECEAPPTPEATPTPDATPTQAAPPTRGPSLKFQQDKSQQGFLPKPKRVLPAWMTSGAAQEGQSGVGRKQAVPAANKTKRGQEPRASLSMEPRADLGLELPRAGLSSEPREGLSSEPRAGLSSEPKAGLSLEEDHGDEDLSGSAPRRKRRKMSSDANTPSKTPKGLPPRNRSNSPGESEEENGRLSDEGAPGSDIRPDRKSLAAGGAGSLSGHTPSQSTRPRCPYGEDCYRKNPLHFQECSHPGDHDYVQEEEEPEPDVDRPECPYGMDCYRYDTALTTSALKNPLHRKEYKHSRRQARTTRTAPRANAGDEDEDDEDSFINDSSDEAYDDSDYVPAGSDDSGQEDIQTLQADAKNFLKRRK